MKKYICEYMKLVESYISGIDKESEASITAFLLEFDKKLTHFMHERLIHLIVTVLFAIMEVMTVIAISICPNITSIVLCVMFLILLIPYVMHYYFLENSVQKLYVLRDKIVAALKQNADKA